MGPERKNWIPASAGMTKTVSTTQTNQVWNQGGKNDNS
jgi:hypothetical protein